MISIVIPAYNEEEHIGPCLRSILSTDFPKTDYEIILVDNGSTDRTREIAEQFNVRVITDPDRNISGLRNLGAEHAKGEILAFIDADCLATPCGLNTHPFIFKTTNSPHGAHLPKYRIIPHGFRRLGLRSGKTKQGLDMCTWLESMNLFVRKDHFTNIGGFNESLVTCEDVDFCYRIGHYGKILSDTAIKTIHLGEAHDIKTFFAKELWRGQSNLQGLWSHGIRRQELPSLMVPVYFGVFIPMLMLISGIWGNKFILTECGFLAFFTRNRCSLQKENKAEYPFNV